MPQIRKKVYYRLDYLCLSLCDKVGGDYSCVSGVIDGVTNLVPTLKDILSEFFFKCFTSIAIVPISSHLDYCSIKRDSLPMGSSHSILCAFHYINNQVHLESVCFRMHGNIGLACECPCAYVWRQGEDIRCSVLSLFTLFLGDRVSY